VTEQHPRDREPEREIVQERIDICTGAMTLGEFLRGESPPEDDLPPFVSVTWQMNMLRDPSSPPWRGQSE
jgi:hypothetical protein